MAFTHSLATNNYGPAKFIVSATASQGTHTTIASALSDAVSGETIFVRPGTYTEDLTLKAGVNIVAFSGDDDLGNVTIVGKATATFTGSCVIANIRLTTNSDFFLVVSGSNLTSVQLSQCYLNCSNNTGISFTSSIAGSVIVIKECFGDIATTGIGLYNSSSAGGIEIYHSEFSNTGASTTASTNSAGAIYFRHSRLDGPISTSGTAALQLVYTEVICKHLNTTAITHNGTGAPGDCFASISYITSGTATAISIGAGASLDIDSCRIISSNGTVISATGTANINGDYQAAISFPSDSGTANPNASGAITFAGAGGVSTSATGSTVTITGSGGSLSTAFLATQTSAQNDIAVGTTTLTINNEVFDVGSDYNNGTYTFTAPSTGKYMLSNQTQLFNLSITNVATLYLETSNRTYTSEFPCAGLDLTSVYVSMICTALADMDSGDTAISKINNSAGTTNDIRVTSGALTPTFFSGWLVG